MDVKESEVLQESEGGSEVVNSNGHGTKEMESGGNDGEISERDERSHEGHNGGKIMDGDSSLDRERHSVRQSSLPDIHFMSSPRRGLDHCITAPTSTTTTQGNSLIDSCAMTLPRSKTHKESHRCDFKFDKLSELDKKNLIANLVKIQRDGTVEVDLDKSTPVASELLELHASESPPVHVDGIAPDLNKSVPKMKIAMLVVGTRGDVQPFLAMAKRLQEFGHHVRLATHINFRDFVKSAGVEFYPLGGDPRVLAGYMARNKGLIPSAPGEITIQRKQLKAIIESLLPACTEPDLETGVPFRAQAIIANPPAYATNQIGPRK